MTRLRKPIVVVLLIAASAVAAIKCTKVVMPHGCPGQLARTLERQPGAWLGESALNGPVKEVQTIRKRVSQVDRYDRKGNHVEREISSSGRHSKTTYSYNSRGELVAANSDWLATSWEYSYFPKKRELVSRMYAVTEAGSSPGSSTVLGKIKSLFSRGKHSRLHWTAIDTFDASGKHIKNRFIPTGQPESWSTLDYDSRGRLVAIASYYPGLATGKKLVLRPDSKGNPIDREVYEDGKLTWSHKASYIYDRRGNWVEKHMTFREVQSGKPPTTAVFYRKISYYDGRGK